MNYVRDYQQVLAIQQAAAQVLEDRNKKAWAEARSKGLSIGCRVMGGEGEDEDTGTLDSIEDGFAIVRWDSLVVTPAAICDLRKLED